MPFEAQGTAVGAIKSPGGFEFGVQGWDWGEPRPRSITFFLDNTAMVCDQHGRAIRGADINGQRIWFATTPPDGEAYKDNIYPQRTITVDDGGRKKPIPLATHAQVIAALEAERIDWQALNCAGWPQLPYAALKALPKLPPTPLMELRKIADSTLRKDALRLRREVDEAQRKEMAIADDE